MKNLKMKFLVLALIGTIFTACEKDEMQPASLKNDEVSSAEKVTSVNNKNDDIDHELSAFIESVVYQDGKLTTMEIKNALEYTESALYWRFSNYDAIPGETQMFDFTYNLSLTNNSGVWEISANDIQSLNNDIYNDLNSTGASASSNEGSTGAKYWAELDVVVPDSASLSSSIVVTLKATLGFKSNGNCNQMISWKGFRNGYCSSYSSKYVTSVTLLQN